MNARIGSPEWREECADMYSPDDDREAFREPNPGEVACDECEEGIRHWMEGVREGYEVCVTCNGSGCVPKPPVLHPVFRRMFGDMRRVGLLPKDEAA